MAEKLLVILYTHQRQKVKKLKQRSDLLVNRLSTSKENAGKRAYQLQNIEKYQLTGKRSQETDSSISPVATGTIHTVADLYAAVKQRGKNKEGRNGGAKPPESTFRNNSGIALGAF